MNAHAVEIRDVSKSYGALVALLRLSLAFKPGEYVVLLGPSGSGKTTLLSILGGFTAPTTGTIHIDGRDITHMPPAQRPTVTVFQDYALFPHMSVEENVAFGLEMRRVPRLERRQQAAQALALVGLDGFGKRRVHEVSGGQRQRVALARAIVIEPAVLLLDEPLGALDLKIRRQMQGELHALQRSLNATFIHVTHDQEEAMSIADTIVLLNKGRIEDIGPPERVYRRPASLFAATFMGDTNIIEGTVAAVGDGEVALDTPLGRVVAATGGKPIGAKVTLSIRPESLRAGTASGGQACPLGSATIEDVVFQGTHRRCHATVEGGNSRLLLSLPADTPVPADARIELWVRPEEVILIDREDE